MHKSFYHYSLILLYFLANFSISLQIKLFFGRCVVDLPTLEAKLNYSLECRDRRALA